MMTMNHGVAYQLLASDLDAYRRLPFDELCSLVGLRSTRRVTGADGVEYDLTMVVNWRTDERGDLRVAGFIGEATWGGPHDTLDETIVISPPPETGRGLDELPQAIRH